LNILDECDVMFGLVWLVGFWDRVFKPRIDFDHNALVLFECDVEYYWTCFIYEILLYIIIYG